MKLTKKDRDSAIGTALQGYLNLSYDEIVSIFGDPNYGSSGDNKTDWEWIFEIDKKIVTIYNYKDGPSYTGESDIKPSDIKDWHVGGKSFSVLKLISNYIKEICGDKFKDRTLIFKNRIF